MDFRRYVTIIVIMWAYYGLLTGAQSIHHLAPLAYQILLGIINSLPKQRARKEAHIAFSCLSNIYSRWRKQIWEFPYGFGLAYNITLSSAERCTTSDTSSHSYQTYNGVLYGEHMVTRCNRFFFFYFELLWNVNWM